GGGDQRPGWGPPGGSIRWGTEMRGWLNGLTQRRSRPATGRSQSELAPGRAAGWVTADEPPSLPRCDSRVQIDNRLRCQASIPSVEVLQPRESALAVAAVDSRLDVGDPGRHLPLYPSVAAREL